MNKLFVALFAAFLTTGSAFAAEAAPVKPTTLKSTEQSVTRDAAAHWLSRDILVVNKHPDAVSYRLRVAELPKSVRPMVLKGVDTPDWLATRFPYLQGFTPLGLALGDEAIKGLLKGDLWLEQYNAKHKLVASSRVQTAGVIDQLFTAGPQDADEVTDYGATVVTGGVQFKLWAPTAQAVTVQLFDAAKKPQGEPLVLQEDKATGAWSGVAKASAGTYYQYNLSVFHPASGKLEHVSVSDPYSHSLSADGFYSQVVDLTAPNTLPANWAAQAQPRVAAPEDNILYELHIRDFSASDTSIKDAQVRGKYAAFSQDNSYGVQHLKALQAAGVNVIHLMPAFDIGTVESDSAKVIALDDPLQKVCALNPANPACKGNYNPSQTLRSLLSSLNPRTGDAQAIIESLRDQDDYNWGYDPFHYTVPNAAYAQQPEGVARIVEFRQMVERLHNMGFKVIMDVVYNHTNAAGLKAKSVLDKVVPDYYHRLNAITGAIEQSTCCDNTATEHAMMAKLMSDSLVVWARDYRINGFRFDLMGHQPKAVMLKAREAVRQVDPDTYFYGEGWNFGEVANNKRFVQSTQTEMGGTEIGTYSDRLRDAVRGGSAMDSGIALRANQGIGNGLYVLPNELQPADHNKAKYLNAVDQVEVGLAGNLANFPLENTAGKQVTGRDIDYNGNPTGYAKDPADTINYVSKHDNQTLWDNNQYRIPYGLSSADRVRLQIVSLSYPLLAQGVPFLHMGCEFLRSKSFLRDSYDYGDWFNAVDFSLQHNNYDVGLPPAVKDEGNWPVIRDVLEKSQGRDHVTPAQMALSSQLFMEFVKIRSSSPLFRLRTAEDIVQRVSFPNAGAKHQSGLIVMKIDNTDPAKNIDPSAKQILVVFNNGPDKQTFAYPDARHFVLHPVQAQGADAVAKTSKASAKGFAVPAFTTAVFIRR